MKLTEHIVFPPFRLDPVNEQLWRENQLVPLPPKTFAVLRYLVEQSGRLVTKEELLKAVWPDTRVSEGVLKGYIRDLREALGDDSHQPRFIETVHRRGFRWLAPLRVASPVPSSKFQVQSSLAPSPQHPTPTLVGRDAELAQLHVWLAKTVNGERQIVFVTGEPGIGKTALVEAFLRSLESRVQSPESQEENQKSKIKRQKAKIEDQSPAPSTQHLTPSPWIGCGQCIEHYGVGEAYLPILSSLGQLCRAAEGKQLVSLLSQHVPMWLVQMPVLLNAATWRRSNAKRREPRKNACCASWRKRWK